MSILFILGAESPAMSPVQRFLDEQGIAGTFATGEGVYRVKPGETATGWYDPESGGVRTDIPDGLIVVAVDGPWGKATISDDGIGPNVVAASLIGKVISFLLRYTSHSLDFQDPCLLEASSDPAFDGIHVGEIREVDGKCWIGVCAMSPDQGGADFAQYVQKISDELERAAVRYASARLSAVFLFDKPPDEGEDIEDTYDDRMALEERLNAVAGRMGLVLCEDDVSCLWDDKDGELVQFRTDPELGDVLVTLDGTLAWYLFPR